MMFAEFLLFEGAACFVAGGAAVFFFLQWQRRGERQAMMDRARLQAAEEAARLREQEEEEWAVRRKEIAETEARVGQRESLVNRQLENLVAEEKTVRAQREEWQHKAESLDVQRAAMTEMLKQQREELGKAARLSPEEARKQLLNEVQKEVSAEAAALSRRIVDEARGRAEEKARHIISVAIQRYAGGVTQEDTTASIELPNDDIKGRIIGREGRNIRAFENATGVTVLVDDSPGFVVLSGFDPVKREVAREVMQRLILDGRIHPPRIEEVTKKVEEEMSETLMRHGEDAMTRLGLAPAHPEIVKLLGRLHYRSSFSQNLLAHSVEVGHLCGLLAAELGADVRTAKRAGLLHDIGKAVHHEIEGPHALVGADLIRQHGEGDAVVNGVAAHHGEVPADGVWAILVGAADAISASRPGARSEVMTTYIKRVENLERLGMEFAGVTKCFAFQSGRELRVLVEPEKVSDDQAAELARELARKIEGELQYPGQIRVVVLREKKCVEYAK